MNKEFLTTSQAAKFLSVSPDTVLKWVKAGKIKSNRTLGGHFRIPVSALDVFSDTFQEKTDYAGAIQLPSSHQYCWEFLAGGGPIRPECKDCITYRSRASRCYELKDLPGGFGCLNLMCDTECAECDYYKAVSGQKLNILILSENMNIIKDPDNLDKSGLFAIQFCENEYSAAMKIQEYRPDYVIVDCAFGKKRTGMICYSLFNDIRIPVVRIILSSKSRDIQDYCDREVFGWIKKPFNAEKLIECLRGVPE